MKSDFLLAITQLSAEKNLPKEVVLTAVETALVSAYKKDSFNITQNVSVKINPNSGQVEIWVEKTVVEKPEDEQMEISLPAAKKLSKGVKIGDLLMVESTPANAGRIAAQTAKQVILQRLHEAEHSAIFEEFADREGDVVTGVVQRMEQGQIFVDLGRTEAILPTSEQVRTERYRMGQRLKVLLLQVMQTPKGPRVVVSRSHPNLLRRLFEMEVPEIYNGTVEIKTIAREAGFRSKVAVAARQEGIDPVGCCVGLRGIRIQNIVNELTGEKIDVIMWSDDPRVFIANALSPANIVRVELDEETEVATVVVPDKQLSLAIGKEGQNARLAAKLAGWRIDIKSASAAEAAKQAAVAVAEEVEEEEEIPVEDPGPGAEALIPVNEAEPEEAPEAVAQDLPDAELVALEAELAELEAQEAEAETATEPEAEPVAFTEENLEMPGVLVVPKRVETTSKIRFAEDIVGFRPGRPEGKANKKKKKRKTPEREGSDDSVKLHAARRGVDVNTAVDDEPE